MVSSGHQGAATRKHLRVLLPFTCDSLRIPDELAEEIGGGEALVVGPSAKVWRVEVGQDLDGAFLGRGWPEFTDACGVDAGWLLVLRHRGQGVLTVKAFDTSFCLRELGTPPAAEATTSSKDASRRPQFISRLRPDSMEKMLIPSKFVQQCIPKLHMSNHRAIVLGPLGKVYPIGLEMNQLDVFFAGGWSQFMAFHGITKANFLLLRYEGNMVFTVKVFEPDGFQRESKPKDIVVQQKLLDNEERQETPSGSTGKRRSKNDWPSSEGQMTSLNKASLRRATFYQIGPPSWIKKQINASTLETKLALSNTFCEVIGLREPCTIILKTSMDSTKSWQVCGFPGKNGSYMLVEGWRRFCQENSLKQGDTCTFNVVETTLWHVTITHYKEKINQLCNQESPSASSRKRKNENMSSSEGQNRPKDSMISLKKASSAAKCVYEIGPPAWIMKEMNASTIENQFSLPLVFCKGIGLRERCMITLKTSMSSSISWQVRVTPFKNCNQMYGSGWKRFCCENGIKVGDICTIKLIETTLWQVTITRR